MMRTGLQRRRAGLWSVWLVSGAPEKGTTINLVYPYQEPALVPLGEKPKTCEFKLVQGNRQISPVT